MPEAAWRAVDVLARVSNGDSLDAVEKQDPITILTKDNLPSDTTKFAPVVDG